MAPVHSTSMIERAMSLVLVMAAAVIAVAAVHRSFVSPAIPTLVRGDGKLHYVADWRTIRQQGLSDSDTIAPVSLLEFGDLECPACRAFHLTTLAEIKQKYGSKLAVTFIHFPLSIHRFAKPAARAAECAANAGGFTRFVETIYSNQDSLGLIPWTTYATRAGLRDTAAFASCLASTPAFARIDSGLAFAKRLELRGTPTIFVNGWRFPSPPGPTSLSKVIDELLAGRNPSAVYEGDR